MAVKRHVIAGVATLASLYVGVSNALGLGELRLESALNQPLNATLYLQGGEGVSAQDVVISLAGQGAFDNAGIERPFFLTDLRFVPVQEGNRLYFKVQSTRPIREPYLNFLVELRQPNGRMLREYTLLLDPPLYNPQAVVASPAVTRAAINRPVQPGQAARSSAQSAAPARPALPDLQPQPGAARYTTVSGDTLWEIASRQRPHPDASVRETMLAIAALNPQAFIDGDINRLRLGQPLVLPTIEQLVSSADARSLATPAARPPASAPDPGVDQVEPAVGVQPPAAADTLGTGRLRIEDVPVSDVEAETAEVYSRLMALETRFNVLLGELEERDARIAALQAELDVLHAARAAEASSEETLAGAAVSGPGGMKPGSGSGPIGSSDSPVPGAVAAEPLPVQSDETGSNSSFWAAWFAIPLVLIALLLIRMLRRRDAKPVSGIEPTASMATSISASESDADQVIARPVVTPAVPKPPVDPLDGVELYITYGRFAEARTLLEKAIEENPQRLELHHRLLRVLAEMGDKPAFLQQEQRILELSGDRSEGLRIRSRFTSLFAGDDELVEQIDHLDPMLEEGAVDASLPEDNYSDDNTSQLNLNDFTLDPDWDLIDALEPEPLRKKTEQGSSAQDRVDEELDDSFESSLHELPDVEELEEDHFGNSGKDKS